eukprot:s8223_g1.t1
MVSKKRRWILQGAADTGAAAATIPVEAESESLATGRPASIAAPAVRQQRTVFGGTACELLLAQEDRRRESSDFGDELVPLEDAVKPKASDYGQAPPEVAESVRRLAEAHYGK